ncbi:MAG: cell wall-binding repeat-containing protein [Thermoleophilaceae bacterium]
MRIPVACAVLASVALAGCSIGGNSDGGAGVPSAAPTSSQPEAAEKLGFPAVATRNTVRVGGGDPVADLAGTVTAVFPATSDDTRPHAVVLVDKDDWQGAIAASVLNAQPLGAPILATDGGGLPAASNDALKRLAPRGADLARDAQVIRVGSKPPAPSGMKSGKITGADPYATAAAVDRFFTAIRGKPSPHVIVASGEQPAFAMPAASWAARSGDSVLFTRRDRVPTSTLRAIAAHEKPDIYVLGPESVISPAAERQLKRLGTVRRVQGPTPVANAVALSRYSRRGFGWGVTVPGYNFALASTTRPLDAAAAATLATNGVFAPMLLTDSTTNLPSDVSGYLLDVQPGYDKDPSTGVYNRVWILGDTKTVPLSAQGRLDEITRLVPVQARTP